MASTEPSKTKQTAETEDITTKVGMKGVAPDQPLNQADSDGKNVEYRGKATLRRITAEQWRAAGVQDQGTVEWSKANGYKVPADKFAAGALDVLRADGSFLVPKQ